LALKNYGLFQRKTYIHLALGGVQMGAWTGLIWLRIGTGGGHL